MTIVPLLDAARARLAALKRRAAAWASMKAAALKVRSIRRQIDNAESEIADRQIGIAYLRGKLVQAEIHLIDRERDHADLVAR